MMAFRRSLFLPEDRLWLLALPVYLLVLIFRHEAGHALSSVLLDGGHITSFSILPRLSESGFVRPHVRATGSGSLVTGFAPYVLDAVGFALFVPVCRLAARGALDGP